MKGCQGPVEPCPLFTIKVFEPTCVTYVLQTEGRPGVFDITLEDGTLVYRRAPEEDILDDADLLNKLSDLGVGRPVS
jgi:hypothetical protein